MSRKQLLIRLPEDLHARIKLVAEESGLSMNAFVIMCVKREVEKDLGEEWEKTWTTKQQRDG
jgi:predicted HicB family RNase H-like nuclease